MAHTRTIDGFEDGVANGSTTGVQLSAARSGLRGWDCAAAVGTGAYARTLSSAHPTVSTDGYHFDYKGRLYFRLQAYPSASDAVIAALRDPFHAYDMLRLEMDTAGHLRVASPVLYMAAARTTAYSAETLSLNVWYGVELRIYGYAGPSHSGRLRGTINVFDAETNETIWSGTTPTQIDVPSSIAYVRALDAATVELRQAAGESAITAGWQTLATV